jgi:hypothetical protein
MVLIIEGKNGLLSSRKRACDTLTLKMKIAVFAKVLDNSQYSTRFTV